MERIRGTVEREAKGLLRPGFSEEVRRASKSCPECGHRDWVKGLRYIHADGTPATALEYGRPWSLERGASAECRNCGAKWPMFSDKARPPEQPPPNVEIVELERETVDDRVESMVLDNLNGSSPLHRTVTVTEEWAQTVEREGERSQQQRKGANLALTGLATMESSAENAVRARYAVSEQQKKTLTDEISFEVPAYTRREVSFMYRRVWQRCLAQLTGPDGEVTEVPFRVAVDMKLDIAQADTKAPGS